MIDEHGIVVVEQPLHASTLAEDRLRRWTRRPPLCQRAGFVLAQPSRASS